MGAANPNIYKACDWFRTFESTAADSHYHACQHGAIRHPNGTCTRTIERETKFQTFRSMLKNREILFPVYLKHIVNMYEFEPKSKWLENSTNDSDSTLVSESDSDFDPNEPESDDDIESCLDREVSVPSSSLANNGFVSTPVLTDETSTCQHNIEHTTPILSDIDDNNNSMSITAIFDQVPAVTSFGRWIEETYGNSPITSNVDENNNQTLTLTVTQNETSIKTPEVLPRPNNIRKRNLNEEPIIKKYIEVERDEMGKQLVDVEGKIVCIMCGRKYKQTGINKHRRACMKYHQDKNILFEEN